MESNTFHKIKMSIHLSKQDSIEGYQLIISHPIPIMDFKSINWLGVKGETQRSVLELQMWPLKVRIRIGLLITLEWSLKFSSKSLSNTNLNKEENQLFSIQQTQLKWVEIIEIWIIPLKSLCYFLEMHQQWLQKTLNKINLMLISDQIRNVSRIFKTMWRLSPEMIHRLIYINIILH